MKMGNKSLCLAKGWYHCAYSRVCVKETGENLVRMQNR